MLKLTLLLVLAAAAALSSASLVDDRVFSAVDYGAIDDGLTDNTEAFSKALGDLVAAGGGRLLLPRSRLGVYRGNIVIPYVTHDAIITVEIFGGVSPAPVFGTVGNLSLCSNCSHSVVQSLGKSGAAVIQAQSSQPPGVVAGFSNVFVYVKNLEVRTYADPSISGVDLLNAQQCKLENVFVNTAVYAAAIPLAPTHNHSAGVVTPHVGNGAMSLLRNVIVTGYFTGIVCNEHTDGDAINVFSNVVGLRFDSANDASWLARVDASDNQHHVKVAGPHGFTIQQLLIENAKGVALTSDAGGEPTCTNSAAKPWGGGWCRCGTPGPWFNTSVGCLNTTDVLDPLNLGHADISIWIVEGGIGAVPAFRKVGGRNIQVRRIGAPPPAPLPVLASAPTFVSDEAEQKEAEEERKDSERLASRLHMLKSLWQEGVLPEPLYHRAVGDELAAWTRHGQRRSV